MKTAIFASGFSAGWLLAVIAMLFEERRSAVKEAERIVRA